ncbi:hypothetical protein [Paraburkholderia phenoliruptrix]|uniref:hypothetical protein n=1 Tax=Paraburkholderia phenoliruptrix TaxID=252970 RepID=UPI000AB76ACC|nr:hypothetical protein [Paraburkholderia phenoliruptrix]MDR6418972.1 hypothetical protein [Paraburkholderia phenoliruptrix]
MRATNELKLQEPVCRVSELQCAASFIGSSGGQACFDVLSGAGDFVAGLFAHRSSVMK